jgi:hypothetical protein
MKVPRRNFKGGVKIVGRIIIPLTIATPGFVLPALSLLVAAWSYS